MNSIDESHLASPQRETPMTKKQMRRYVSTLVIHGAVLTWMLAPAPAFAAWWIVRSSDEKCLVVDVEPFPGDKDVIRLGKASYQTEQEAKADLTRLCPDSAFRRSSGGD